MIKHCKIIVEDNHLLRIYSTFDIDFVCRPVFIFFIIFVYFLQSLNVLRSLYYNSSHIESHNTFIQLWPKIDNPVLRNIMFTQILSQIGLMAYQIIF